MLNSLLHIFFNSGKGCQKRVAAASNWYRFKCREGGGAVTKQIITSIWIISTTQYTQWARCLLWPWSSKTDYFENTRQNLSSHLELVISENIWFFACYLSIDFYNKHRRSRPWKVFLGYCALYLPFLTRCSLLRFFLALWQLNGEIKSLFIHWIRFLIGDLQYLFLNSLYMAE